jgi:hypothetical protein
MKMVYKSTDFYYALMDKGYINPQVDAYANLIGRKVIIDQRQYEDFLCRYLHKYKLLP